MLHTLKLLLPALLPSWRFFDIIAPSPRIQYSLLSTENETPHKWNEFRPRPEHLPFIQMVKRLLWNPEGNETLFMISCAERLLQEPTKHSEDEILKRIINDLKVYTPYIDKLKVSYIQFRLLIIYRDGSQLQQEIVLHSRIEPLSDYTLFHQDTE